MEVFYDLPTQRFYIMTKSERCEPKKMNTVVERDGGDQQFQEKEEKESVGVVREHGKD